MDAGEDVYVEIEKASQNPDVTLDKMFNFPIHNDLETGKAVFSTNEDGSLKGYDDNGKITDSVAKVVKENGQWKIIFSLPIKYTNDPIYLALIRFIVELVTVTPLMVAS